MMNQISDFREEVLAVTTIAAAELRRAMADLLPEHPPKPDEWPEMRRQLLALARESADQVKDRLRRLAASKAESCEKPSFGGSGSFG